MTLLITALTATMDLIGASEWEKRRTYIYIYMTFYCRMPRRQQCRVGNTSRLGKLLRWGKIDAASIHSVEGTCVTCNAQHNTTLKNNIFEPLHVHCLVKTTFHFSVVVPNKTFHCALRCYSCIVMTRRPTVVLMPLQHSFKGL